MKTQHTGTAARLCYTEAKAVDVANYIGRDPFPLPAHPFVSGAFEEKYMKELRGHPWYKARLDEARDAYLTNRKNGVEGDSPAHPFPGDGAYSWDTPEIVESKIRYTEGPQDKAWMEARDRKYVFRLEQEGRLDLAEPNLQTEVPNLYAEVMAKRQARLAEEKMAQEAQVRLAARQKKLEEDLIYARKQFSKGGERWVRGALSTFQEILSDYPNHFEALCFVAKINLEQEGDRAIDAVTHTILQQFTEVPEAQRALYVTLVHKLVLQLLTTGMLNHAEQALLVCETALLRVPQDPTLLQSQQQAISKVTAKAKDLQDKEPTVGEPPYSPRTHYYFFQKAKALEEKVQAHTGEAGRENLIFLYREMQRLEAQIAQLPVESPEATAAREARLQQALRIGEAPAATKPLSEGTAVTEQKLESDSRDFVSERVRQWQAANAGAVDVDAHPFEDDLEAAMGMSVMTAEFRSNDCNLIANELVKRICREGTFGISTEPDEYIEIRCRPDKVAPLVAQALKATLSKLFTGLDGNDTQIIRLPWEQLNDKQVRKFEVLFAREKQDIRLASIQDAGEDIKSGVDGVARRGAPTP